MPRYDLNGDPIPEEGNVPPPVDSASIPRVPPGYVPPPPGSPGYTSPQPGAPGYAPPPGSTARPTAPSYNPSSPSAYPPQGRPTSRPAVDRNPASVRWIAGGTIAFIALAVVILVAHPASVATPTAFSTYTSPNGTFTALAPNGWKIEKLKDSPTGNASDAYLDGGDSTDSSAVAFTSGSAKIAIYQGTIQSITGSLSQFLPATELITRYRDDLITNRFSRVDVEQNYTFVTEGFGDGACETWSAPRTRWGLPNPIRGYFVAMSGGNYYVVVDCECRASDWPNLKQAFQHVVDTLTELPAPGYQGGGSDEYPSGPPPGNKPSVNTTPGL